MKNPKVRQVVLPLITALIWGSAFVTQSLSAGKHLGPCFSFNALRAIPAVLVLLVLLAVHFAAASTRAKNTRASRKMRAAARRALSAARFWPLAINLQQFGMEDDERGQGGLYHGALHRARAGVRHGAIGKKAKQEHVALCDRLRWRGFISSALTGSECALRFSSGDLYVFLCAFAFTAPDHCLWTILCEQVDGIALSCVAVRQWSLHALGHRRACIAGEHTTLDGGEGPASRICSTSAWCTSGVGYTLPDHRAEGRRPDGRVAVAEPRVVFRGRLAARSSCTSA